MAILFVCKYILCETWALRYFLMKILNKNVMISTLKLINYFTMYLGLKKYFVYSGHRILIIFGNFSGYNFGALLASDDIMQWDPFITDFIIKTRFCLFNGASFLGPFIP